MSGIRASPPSQRRSGSSRSGSMRSYGGSGAFRSSRTTTAPTASERHPRTNGLPPSAPHTRSSRRSGRLASTGRRLFLRTYRHLYEGGRRRQALAFGARVQAVLDEEWTDGDGEGADRLNDA